MVKIDKKHYTKEFLLLEIYRFYSENDRRPKSKDMTAKNGYPTARTYQDYFGTWNNALIIAKLKINKTHEKRTGDETCCICGCTKKETQSWHTRDLPKGLVMCSDCYYNVDYKNGNLDKNSTVGKGFIGQRVVAKVLNIPLKNDCNCSVGFKHPYDLFKRNKYKKIDVKTSKLLKNNAWQFTLKNKEKPNTYIMLGYDEERKNILHVWICKLKNSLVFKKKGVIIKNTYEGLIKAKPWEVDNKPYNEAYHSMSLEKCGVLRK